MLLLLARPQFRYQAPPGAQQLTLPDFSNVPHFGHVLRLVIVEVMADALVRNGVRTMSSRSIIGRRVEYWRVIRVVIGVYCDGHAVPDINPEHPSNICVLLAFEWSQASPQS